MAIPDQQILWNQKHQIADLAKSIGIVNELAVHTEKTLARHSTVLDIGCGVGEDARFFASKGHSVVATDFSEIAIDINRKTHPYPGVEYRQLDVTDLSQFGDGSFDAVYAHLSLHYFDNETTTDVFEQIARVLTPSGVFAFACKMIGDKYDRQGEMIAENIYVYEGHVRHFFSKEYSESLLADHFEVVNTWQHQKKLYNDTAVSSVIYFITKKIR